MKGPSFFLVCYCVLLAARIVASTMEPLSIPPSLFWDGDDGWWSSFHVQVGSPPQTLRVLPGTSASAGSVSWIVNDLGCSAVNPTLLDCSDRRGNLFHSNRSDSWSTEGLQNGADGAIYTLNTKEEVVLNRQGQGSYGYDTVILGSSGQNLPKLEHQLIAQIWTNDFFLGSLGLSPHPFNFTDFDDPQPSILSTLYNNSLLPSLSWAYTAGAHYQSRETFGSLTFGGYDTTRFTESNVSFAFGNGFTKDLMVHLESITYNTEGADALLNKQSSIDVFIDSLVPEIWLPVNICKQFEQTFNLTWHDKAQLYTVKEDAHRALLAQNPEFTFELSQVGGSAADNSTTKIVLPYAAFDLNLTSPIAANETRWFPLKQAQNSSQYTLGRTFLQEAYLIVDYERRNFSVSQALFPWTSGQQNLVAIEPPSADSRSGKPSLSSGAIAGIVIGSATISCAVAFIAWLCMKRRREPNVVVETVSNEKTADWSTPVEEVDASDTALHEVDGSRSIKPELVAYEGAQGRHELLTEEGVKEVVGTIVPVELEAPVHSVEKKNNRGLSV